VRTRGCVAVGYSLCAAGNETVSASQADRCRAYETRTRMGHRLNATVAQAGNGRNGRGLVRSTPGGGRAFWREGHGGGGGAKMGAAL
jgi:hypothetical protein